MWPCVTRICFSFSPCSVSRLCMRLAQRAGLDCASEYGLHRGIAAHFVSRKMGWVRRANPPRRTPSQGRIVPEPANTPNRRPASPVRRGGLAPLTQPAPTTPLPFPCQAPKNLSPCIHTTSICR
jgi:hypothetical protein